MIVCGAVLLFAGCATWQPPPAADLAAVRDRALSETVDGVRLSAVVLSAEESLAIFGQDVVGEGIQPIWIEIENPTSYALFLLRSGTDPDYFSPLEVAWSFHELFSPAANRAMDDHFRSLDFVNPIPPGAVTSGIIFTNPHSRTRLFSVDLVGGERMRPYTLFLPVPDQPPDSRALRLLARHSGAGDNDIVNLDELREALERLPCCAEGADGEPMNAVFIGTMADISVAIVRRGFRSDRREIDDLQRLYGRAPDFVARRNSQYGSPGSWVRLWAVPMSYRNQSVILAQVGRPVMGRFAASQDKPVLHPHVDEVRNLLVQEMLYSGGLAKFGFVEGAGTTEPDARTRYRTNGLRAVLFFGGRPLSMLDTEFIDWVH